MAASGKLTQKFAYGSARAGARVGGGGSSLRTAYSRRLFFFITAQSMTREVIKLFYIRIKNIFDCIPIILLSQWMLF